MTETQQFSSEIVRKWNKNNPKVSVCINEMKEKAKEKTCGKDSSVFRNISGLLYEEWKEYGQSHLPCPLHSFPD